MSNVEKVFVRRHDGFPIEYKNKDRVTDNFPNQIKIAYYLSKINAFNENGYMRNTDGSFSETSVFPYIRYCTNHGTNLKKLDQFIKLMVEAKVPKELIKNEEIREKLAQAEQPVEISEQIVAKPSVQQQEVVLATNIPPKRRKKAIPTVQRKSPRLQQKKLSNNKRRYRVQKNNTLRWIIP